MLGCNLDSVAGGVWDGEEKSVHLWPVKRSVGLG